MPLVALEPPHRQNSDKNVDFHVFVDPYGPSPAALRYTYDTCTARGALQECNARGAV